MPSIFPKLMNSRRSLLRVTAPLLLALTPVAQGRGPAPEPPPRSPAPPAEAKDDATGLALLTLDAGTLMPWIVDPSASAPTLDGAATRVAALRTRPTAAYLVDVAVARVPRKAMERAAAGVERMSGIQEALYGDQKQVRSFSAALPDDVGHEWFASVRGHVKAETRFGQGLGLRSLLLARAFDGRELPYVKDYDLQVGRGGFVLEPEIGRVRDGIEVRVAVAPAAEGDGCELALGVVDRKVELPIPTFDTTLPGSTMKVTLQLPTSRSWPGVARQELALDEALALVWPGPEDSVYCALATAKALTGESR